ncbi:hypothetical protein BdWA1_000375 [Babesia duncani]|uniref:Lon N-terminal domain-containing protein n=1 Tax=Babesia duncani TaxID=323732 RepID=A0AAD9PMP9_9APIC|nr:hypothetical protein BdWA1_000375 [Babesia duncani]
MNNFTIVIASITSFCSINGIRNACRNPQGFCFLNYVVNYRPSNNFLNRTGYYATPEDEEPLDSRFQLEELEKENIQYIDKGDFVENATEAQDNTQEEYIDMNRINQFQDVDQSPEDEILSSIDSNPIVHESGDRPIISGHGMDMEFKVENYEINSTCGRLNEWHSSWDPATKVMSFFPILIDEYSLHPSPLQIGFEEPIRFRGKHVESTFNSLLETIQNPNNPDERTREIFGICFLNPTSGQLAPLAVYAELLNKEVHVQGTSESLIVTGRVLGRVMISRVLLEEPFIKAQITPIEDRPGLREPASVAKIIDEITNLHNQCNAHEIAMMNILEQPYAIEKIKQRPDLHDLIDARMNSLGIDLNTHQQAFAQIAAYCGFEWHLTASERYDALTMQDSEARLVYVRDNLRMKLRQLQLLKSAPREQLEDMIEKLKNIDAPRDELYNPT